ncbi:predicted protein [Naegleria gruberi]|uniref:Predicted protein n=1 Tax=Naegleria gruberi TaxID=5762 RepID=D2VE04_NAEGR|nr:uncharacterized protein NAEGRDRAFT_48781 [Naegleria gruberi]EFC45089.1 predicted protein [Naegleria gruberi]|eukprot:XP_002677833.1 predicted protein [Naegleria gruberi strain NEG-M]
MVKHAFAKFATDLERISGGVFKFVSNGNNQSPSLQVADNTTFNTSTTSNKRKRHEEDNSESSINSDPKPMQPKKQHMNQPLDKCLGKNDDFLLSELGLDPEEMNKEEDVGETNVTSINGNNDKKEDNLVNRLSSQNIELQKKLDDAIQLQSYLALELAKTSKE